jgi:hypothetical protein
MRMVNGSEAIARPIAAWCAALAQCGGVAVEFRRR